MNTLTLIRHLAAVAAAWLTTTLVGALGLDVGPEQVAEVQGALTTLGATLLLGLYAAIEKLLKPLFHRLGEPREVTRPSGVPQEDERFNAEVLAQLGSRRRM